MAKGLASKYGDCYSLVADLNKDHSGTIDVLEIVVPRHVALPEAVRAVAKVNIRVFVVRRMGKEKCIRIQVLGMHKRHARQSGPSHATSHDEIWFPNGPL